MAIDIDKFIPPQTYEEREGFSNKGLVNSLNAQERFELEEKLIQLVSNQGTDVDTLIIDTLVHMKSQAVMPSLRKILTLEQLSPFKGIMIASAIYEISNSQDMVEVVVGFYSELTDNSDKMLSLYYLSKINVPEIKNILQMCSKDKDYLLSFHAKENLKIMINKG